LLAGLRSAAAMNSSFVIENPWGGQSQRVARTRAR
jgi:hypothetical protein